MPSGAIGIVCTSRRGPFCKTCRRPADVLCDFPIPHKLGTSQTCDTPCCRAHAKPIAPGVDHCVPHVMETLASTHKSKEA
jgi:hypothetical protein